LTSPFSSHNFSGSLFLLFYAKMKTAGKNSETVQQTVGSVSRTCNQTGIVRGANHADSCLFIWRDPALILQEKRQQALLFGTLPSEYAKQVDCEWL
jgi:hypothetical protein